MAKRFSYGRWAKEVAASILESDIACGFEVADTTPEPEKARAAIQELIIKLRRKSG